MNTSKPPPIRPNHAGREWAIISILTLVGAVLRFQGFASLGLTHFDEGIYAFGGLWTISPRGLAAIDPGLIYYAPPGYPVLVGLAYQVFGVCDSAALFVSVVTGSLTILVVGWGGRRTFGEGAGAAAAAFAALAMAHVALSRKALTDAPFLLAWVISLGLGSRFLERPGFVRAVVFGLAVGAAQNLKYNGWVAGGVVIVAALAGLRWDEERRPTASLRTFGLGLIAVVVALGCYVPWYAFIEGHGGYAGLVRHHNSYLGGAGTWGPFWRTQLAQVISLSGGRGWVGTTWLVAGISGSVVAHDWASSRVRSRDGFRLAFRMLAGAIYYAFVPDLGWWAGLVMAGPLMLDRRPARRVVGAWWVVLTCLTPCYHPYARLWLPLHAVGWLMLSWAVVASRADSWRLVGDAFPGKSIKSRNLVLPLGLVVLCVVARGDWRKDHPKAMSLRRMFAPTDELRKAVTVLRENEMRVGDTFESHPVPVLVLGRRPVAFYLATQGGVEVRLLADERGLIGRRGFDEEWALVDEARLIRRPHEIVDAPDVRRIWQPFAVLSTRLDPVTLLDIDPGAAFATAEAKDVPLVLLRRRSIDSKPTPDPFQASGSPK